MDNPNNLQPDLPKGRFICFSPMKVFFVPRSAERAHTLFKELEKFKVYQPLASSLRMVCTAGYLGRFETRPIKMKKPRILDLSLYYGDDFPKLHEQLIKSLRTKNSTGVSFLHGPPGTGKTNYLRYLINEIKGKQMIYIPPDLVQEITKPSFLTFLMEHPNSILIIEDAENIVQDRTDMVKSANQAVSNLLNMSDGLLGDAVHQQIICTFNCDLRNIDSALLRDGRLVLEHKFDKLSPANARRLCEKLGVDLKDEEIRAPMSLAEIYARTSPVEQASNDSEGNETHDKTNKRAVGRSTVKAKTCLNFYS